MDEAFRRLCLQDARPNWKAADARRRLEDIVILRRYYLTPAFIAPTSATTYFVTGNDVMSTQVSPGLLYWPI
jgi:hypothetical protein